MKPDSTELTPLTCRAAKTAKVAVIKAACMALAVLAFYCAAVAQAPGQSAETVDTSRLKTLSFGFERRASTHLEIAQVETNNSTIPTQPYAYRPELGGEPARGRDYYEYKTHQVESQYAVLKVKNDSGKTIDSIDWVFTYPRFKGGKEVADYKVHSGLKIADGQIASLAEKLPRDGCGVIYIMSRGTEFIARACGRAKRKTTSTYPVGARVRKVKFSDGTVWEVAP